jgi:hypothetical protein
MNAALNSQRWAVDQKKQARAAFAEILAPVSKVRAWRLAELRQMAEMMEALPHMADMLAGVRAAIAKLES